MAERVSPKTVREAQLAVRRFFRFLLAEEEIAIDPTRDMKLMTFRVKPQATYSEVEVKKLVLVCDMPTRESLRDAAPVSVLFDTGAREGELVAMAVPDLL